MVLLAASQTSSNIRMSHDHFFCSGFHRSGIQMEQRGEKQRRGPCPAVPGPAGRAGGAGDWELAQRHLAQKAWQPALTVSQTLHMGSPRAPSAQADLGFLTAWWPDSQRPLKTAPCKSAPQQSQSIRLDQGARTAAAALLTCLGAPQAAGVCRDPAP